MDCGINFFGNDFAAHTSCVTEKEKYEGKLYKGKKNVPVGVPTTSKPAEQEEKKSKKKRKVEEEISLVTAEKKKQKTTDEAKEDKEASVSASSLISSILGKKAVTFSCLFFTKRR